MPSPRLTPSSAAIVAVLLASLARPAAAQGAAPPVWTEYAADDELENYLRSLQALGEVGAQPWSLRRFSPVQLDRLRPGAAGHPWAARVRGDSGGSTWAMIRPRVELRYNSTFPFGSNDGAIWAGRGATGAISAGAALRWRGLSLVLAPVAFWSQNSAFPLLDNGFDDTRQFGDGLYPASVDRPQRFGDGAYARVDPGQSTLRLDALGVSVGASTANLWWGPAQQFPFLLGTNAAGFQHVFVGTAAPANLWIARVHSQLFWGRLEQSDHFAPQPGTVQRPRRFATGLLVTFSPRGLDNVEIGAARFFHAPWPDEGMPSRYLTRSFEGLFKKSLPEVDDPIDTDSRSIDGENQLASVFARLVVPGSGFEVYGEVGREDHPWDIRHLLLSPDEQSSITVGFRQSWARSGDRMVVLRGESMNYQQRSIDRRRLGPAVYRHASGSNQGHTHRGQLLGADIGVGSAAGAMAALDVLDRRGRTTLHWRRIVRQERAEIGPGYTANEQALDVGHTVGLERLIFRGSAELELGLDISHNLNRDFGADRTNLSVRVGAAGLGW